MADLANMVLDQILPGDPSQFAQVAGDYIYGAVKPMMAAGAISAYNKFSAPKKSLKSPRQMGRSSRRSTATIIPQGDNAGTKRIYAKKKRKRRKASKSLAAQVKRLRKQMVKLPPQTVEKYRRMRPIQLESVHNQKKLFTVRVFDSNVYELGLANVNGITDLLNKKTAVWVKNRYYSMKLKCFSNTNAKLRYQFFKATHSDSEGPLAKIIEENANRGISIAGALNGKINASATTNCVPISLGVDLDNQEFFAGTFSSLNSRHFKKLGAITTCDIGPGDNFNISKSFGSHLYKPELADDDATAIMDNDIYLMLELTGDFVKNKGDLGTAPDLFGFGPSQLIGYDVKSFNLCIQDGKGMKITDLNNQVDGTNLASATGDTRTVTNQDPTTEVPGN